MKIKLAENIKKFRKEHSFTQEQLAEALGVTVGAVYKWEAGLSTPEIKLIMELADMFEVSVDVLLGYEQQNENVENRVARIEQCIYEKNFEEAAVEAEKALKKYPNHFDIVYICGVMYQLKYIEEKEAVCIERSNALLQHAITLLYQNEETQINEVTILNQIAQNYLLVEKTDLALESLKKNNVCGINNSLIGLTYARTQKKPEEAKLHLVKSYADCIGNLIRTLVGFGYMYMELKDYKRSTEALGWLERMLDSMKMDPSQITFTDQLKVALWAQSAIWEAEAGKLKKAKELLEKTYALVVEFDAAPVYNLAGIKFLEEEVDSGIAYLDIGSTATEAVENILYEDAVSEAGRHIQKLWEEIKSK